jgi:hypothetical protein
MPKKKAPELTDQERAKRIKEMAREVEADETGEAFKRTFKKIAGPLPKRPKGQHGSKKAS